MQADTIRMFFTYLLALIVVVGGGVMLFVSRLDPKDSASQSIALVLAGFIGAAISFVFNKETQTSTAIQTRNAVVTGQNTQPPTA